MLFNKPKTRSTNQDLEISTQDLPIAAALASTGPSPNLQSQSRPPDCCSASCVEWMCSRRVPRSMCHAG